MKKLSLVIAVLLFHFSALTGFSQKDLPLNLPEAVELPLRSHMDEDLNKRLLKALQKKSKWNQLIQSKRLAVGLVDIRDLNDIRFANINGDEMMYAASLPKIAILLAAMDAMERGELKETEVIREDLHAMIAYSNNKASTRMIDRVGYKNIERTLTDPSYKLYDQSVGGGLWVGKRYAAGGERYPDPMKGISHAATATQVCRFYYLLALGKLVSPERSEQMLGIMDNPALHHKFVNTLDQIAPEAEVYRKSGSWKNYHSDSVLVWGKNPNRRYILVALIDDPSGEQIIRSLLKEVENILQI